MERGQEVRSERGERWTERKTETKERQRGKEKELGNEKF